MIAHVPGFPPASRAAHFQSPWGAPAMCSFIYSNNSIKHSSDSEAGISGTQEALEFMAPARGSQEGTRVKASQ